MTIHDVASRLAFVFAAGTALAACSSPAPDAAPVDTGITYYRDTKAIIDAKCTGCHTDGGIAPFVLEGYENASHWSSSMRDPVATRAMPPWLAGKGCNEYADDRSLTDAEIDTLTKWIDRGAPAGDPADFKGTQNVDSGLSRVDATLGMVEPYTAQLEPDDYRCFLLDWPETETMFVTGFQANPGNAKVVHHVIAYLIPPGSVASYEALDKADPKPGYTCFGGPGNTIDPATSFIGSWAPGSRGGDLPAGTGIKVEPGSKIALQVHYNTTNGGPQPDQTSVQVKLDKKVEKEATWQFFTNVEWVLGQGMDIPAMTQNKSVSYEVDATQYVSGGKPFAIYDAALHMHTRGKHTKLSIDRKDSTNECLLDIPKWNFHWQLAYQLQDRTIFNPGDKLKIECSWFNDQPHDIHWGEGTGDEMCLGVVLISAP